MRPIDADELKESIRVLLGIKSFDYLLPAEKAVVQLIDQMQTLETQEWTPVAEGLPDEHYLDDGWVDPSRPVLVYLSFHVYRISRYWGHRKTKGTGNYVIPDWVDLEEYDSENVVAWMPLPEPWGEQVMTVRDRVSGTVRADVKLMDDGTLRIRSDELADIKQVIIEDSKTHRRTFCQDPQAEQRMGKWIPHRSKYGKDGECVYTCDKCGENIGFRKKNFCPNCGIKMDLSDRTCGCYREDGRCTGTREIDPCSCGGVRSRCDFYDSVRKEGNAE